MKKTTPPLTQPLSERELNWLQDYLDTLSQTHDDCMTLEVVDGLFCALIVNPVMAKPSEWIKMIFGEKHEFKSEAELEKVMMLLIRYWNQVSTAIEKTEGYFPRFLASEKHSAQKWIYGFRKGMDYCSREWNEFSQHQENARLLLPFYSLDKEDNLEQKKQLSPLISQNLHRLFHYWVGKTATDKKETKTKIGRNDPCPCGSGKKYKKCCEGQSTPTIH